MADLTQIEFFRDAESGSNMDFQTTVARASKLGFIGFHRASAEAIGIEISIIDNSISYKMIDLAASVVTDIVITDEFTISAGSIVKIATTGVATGAVNGFLVLEAIIV